MTILYLAREGVGITIPTTISFTGELMGRKRQQ
jgi:hypothetical protein